MAQSIYKTIAAPGAALINLDWQQSPFNLSYAVEVPAGVTTSFTVSYTLDDVNDLTWTPVWINDPTNGSSQTATVAGNYNFPIRWLMINVASLSGGAALIRAAVIQGSSSR